MSVRILSFCILCVLTACAGRSSEDIMREIEEIRIVGTAAGKEYRVCLAERGKAEECQDEKNELERLETKYKALEQELRDKHK